MTHNQSGDPVAKAVEDMSLGSSGIYTGSVANAFAYSQWEYERSRAPPRDPASIVGVWQVVFLLGGTFFVSVDLLRDYNTAAYSTGAVAVILLGLALVSKTKAVERYAHWINGAKVIYGCCLYLYVIDLIWGRTVSTWVFLIAAGVGAVIISLLIVRGILSWFFSTALGEAVARVIKFTVGLSFAGVLVFLIFRHFYP